MVVGKVVSLKWVENEYGSTLKMTVLADGGYRVWATVPAHLNPATGDRIELHITLEKSEKDPTFAFGKRPTKKSRLLDA